MGFGFRVQGLGLRKKQALPRKFAEKFPKREYETSINGLGPGWGWFWPLGKLPARSFCRSFRTLGVKGF